MCQSNEQKDKLLLSLEFVIGWISSVTFLTLLFLVSYIKMPTNLMVILIILAIIIFIIGIGYALKIEQVVGYYECRKCNHKYIPNYLNVFLAPHIGRTRYMKCPKCQEKSWNKKILTK